MTSRSCYTSKNSKWSAIHQKIMTDLFIYFGTDGFNFFNRKYLSPGCHEVAQRKKECMEFHSLVAIQSWRDYCLQLQCGKDPLKCRWDLWHVPDIPCKQPAFIRKLIQIYPVDSELKTWRHSPKITQISFKLQKWFWL